MTHWSEIEIQHIVGIGRVFTHRRERVQFAHAAFNLVIAIERTPRPRCREIAPLRQFPRRSLQSIDRAVLTRARAEKRERRRSPEGTPHTFRRIGQLLLQPPAKRLFEQPLRLRFGQHSKQRVDARLDRPLAQQLGTEPMNRIDVGFFEAAKRLVEPLARFRIRR
jgi:hypothetical protein